MQLKKAFLSCYLVTWPEPVTWHFTWHNIEEASEENRINRNNLLIFLIHGSFVIFWKTNFQKITLTIFEILSSFLSAAGKCGGGGSASAQLVPTALLDVLHHARKEAHRGGFWIGLNKTTTVWLVLMRHIHGNTCWYRTCAHPERTPSTRLRTKNEPMMMRGMK